jgi:ATP adenylyltransferase
MSDLVQQHKSLLQLTRSSLGGEGEVLNHNVVLVKDWLMMIPRTHRDQDGVAANAAGMVGVVWVDNAYEVLRWLDLGLTDHLAYLGVSAKTSK